MTPLVCHPRASRAPPASTYQRRARRPRNAALRRLSRPFDATSWPWMATGAASLDRRSRPTLPVAGEAMQDDLPEGYELIRPDHPQGGPRGLRLGSPYILATSNDCWVARVRNTARRRDQPRWLWIWEADERAVLRYRRRAWIASRGSPPPADHKLCPACETPQCLNPAHLVPRKRRLPACVPPADGRFGWIGEGGDERWGWIPDARPPRPPRPGRALGGTRQGPPAPRNHTVNRKRGEEHGRAS
jgi:hypothetical protein